MDGDLPRGSVVRVQNGPRKPTDAELENRFVYHPLVDTVQDLKYQQIRSAGLQYAKLIRDLCPCSPEMTRAINAVDEAMMLANAAIARHYQPGVE